MNMISQEKSNILRQTQIIFKQATLVFLPEWVIVFTILKKEKMVDTNWKLEKNIYSHPNRK